MKLFDSILFLFIISSRLVFGTNEKFLIQNLKVKQTTIQKMPKTTNIQKEEYSIIVPGGRVCAIKYFSNITSKKTPLLIVHGGPGMAHDYLLTLIDLANERPIIFYDQLGCGKSARPNDNSLWNLSRFVEELKCVIDQLKLKETHLLGHSWGGAIVTEFALSNSNLKSLILASPYLSTKVWMNDANNLKSQLPKNIQTTLNRKNYSSKEYTEALMTYYKKHFCRLNPWPKVLSNLLDDLDLSAYQTIWGPSDFIMNGNLRNFDRIEDLSKISYPILLTCGRYDEATPNTMQNCFSKLKNGYLKIFEQSSHVAMLEETQNYINFLELFLEKIETFN